MSGQRNSVKGWGRDKRTSTFLLSVMCQAALYLIAIRDCQKTVETKWKHCFDAGLSGIDVERTDFGFGGLFDNDLGYSVRVRRSV